MILTMWLLKTQISFPIYMAWLETPLSLYALEINRCSYYLFIYSWNVHSMSYKTISFLL